MSYTEAQLVSLLQKASDAYYNKENPILSDEKYDDLRDELERRFPDNPYLKQVGAPIEKGAVLLPFKMASLNKIKPETGAVETFASSSRIKQWVLSDKLDGISVLWDTGKKKLYLRGDGLMGVDVSAFAPYISGLYPKNYSEKWVLRGELVLPSSVPIEGTLPRSWVNGQLHQKKPIPENLKQIHFVAYELVQPANHSRSEQFKKIGNAGFEVPIYCEVNTLNDDALCSYLLARREKSLYAIDGIVVGENCVPVKDESNTVTNPKDMRAFKMPLDDQKATTTVVDVLWSASHQGYWIPRLQIQPVIIGGSRIEFLTAHNARVIVQHKLGKGATIVVRKSGDVIPTLERVLSLGEAAALPEGEWDGDEKTASHYRVKSGVVSDEMKMKKLEHFVKTLDIPHLGPGLVKKLVEEGKDTPNDLLTISLVDLEVIVGKGMAAKIYPAIQKSVGLVSELELMIGSSMMPRGVGGSKLEALFHLEADPRKWSTIKSCEGWSFEALQTFFASLPSYEAWRRNELPVIPYPKITEWHKLNPGVLIPPPRGYVCVTGFRDTAFQKQMEERGFIFVNSVTKKTTHLIVKDHTDTSEKKSKAEVLEIRILTREEASKEYL